MIQRCTSEYFNKIYSDYIVGAYNKMYLQWSDIFPNNQKKNSESSATKIVNENPK